ncbi:hypothetical protein FHT86_006448 [Rhizobium sp. BK313]|uniref:hypothetical protein n=1 Tax=Rhizobium sp. BK313 TaxID=2587081 RepID=UPI0010D799AB|nr:hypothetical protein [Rhizobium sp. BK313]MBB3458123.1 hypothetical protein [Rhizobium sp. BK313]
MDRRDRQGIIEFIGATVEEGFGGFVPPFDVRTEVILLFFRQSGYGELDFDYWIAGLGRCRIVSRLFRGHFSDSFRCAAFGKGAITRQVSAEMEIVLVDWR